MMELAYCFLLTLYIQHGIHDPFSGSVLEEIDGGAQRDRANCGHGWRRR